MDSISIVIPAYNEEQRLGSTLNAILSFLNQRPSRFAEILVVDDGSRDATARIVERFSVDHPQIRLLRNPGNRGKGYSVRHGVLESRGEWILFTDADLSAPIEELDKLFDAVRRHDADIAIGSRALDRSLIQVHQSWFRETAGRIFNLFLRILTGLPFLDTQCGFKLYRRQAAHEIFRRQRLERFGFDAEVLYIARRFVPTCSD
ncbi:MAG: glycosyltransferase family 2 protein, partial [Bryobacteraceae bacterium]|nr:glycosyltransferase family 2 protein [Bryobacteraceae bacterium]